MNENGTWSYVNSTYRDLMNTTWAFINQRYRGMNKTYQELMNETWNYMNYTYQGMNHSYSDMLGYLNHTYTDWNATYYDLKNDTLSFINETYQDIKERILNYTNGTIFGGEDEEYRNRRAADLDAKVLGRFIEGFLFGVLDEQYVDLHECLGDVGSIQTDLYLAVQDFDQ